MRMLAIYNGTNKKFRHDGDEFQREARLWAGAQLINDFTIPLTRDVRDGKVRAEIRKMTDGLDVLAIFDHGRPMDLPRMREDLGNVKGLAATIAKVTEKITIVLYACSCGRGWWGRKGFRWMNKKNKRDTHTPVDGYNPRDGYAIALCSELAKLGVDAVVYAHLTAGHTTWNPHVVKVIPIGNNRMWRVRAATFTESSWRKWVAKMKTSFRFTFWRESVL